MKSHYRRYIRRSRVFCHLLYTTTKCHFTAISVLMAKRKQGDGMFIAPNSSSSAIGSAWECFRAHLFSKCERRHYLYHGGISDCLSSPGNIRHFAGRWLLFFFLIMHIFELSIVLSAVYLLCVQYRYHFIHSACACRWQTPPQNKNEIFHRDTFLCGRRLHLGKLVVCSPSEVPK